LAANNPCTPKDANTHRTTGWRKVEGTNSVKDVVEAVIIRNLVFNRISGNGGDPNPFIIYESTG
jgi:hypothetical protein